jgi:hypothetical protein
MWTRDILVGHTPSLHSAPDMFHVSQLKKCLKAPLDVVLHEVTPLEADLSYPVSNQGTGLERLCHEAEDYQVL